MNTKKYLVLVLFMCAVLAGGLLLFSWSAKGQILATSDSENTEINDNRLKNKVELNDDKKQLQASGTPVLNKEQLKVDAQNRIQEIKDAKEEYKNKVEAAREEMKQKVEVAKEALKTKLQGIKDLNKRMIVERIDGSLNKLNEKLLDHYSDILDKLEKVLNRINEKVKTDSAKGLDTTTVYMTITAATEKIKLARTAIEVQAGKTYPVKITTESKLKVDVGAVRQTLHDDLVKVRDAVKAAREAVHKVAVALGQLHGIKPTPTASPSTTATPTVSPTATPTPSSI